MQLIGMLDSPYVRRVAVSLQLLGLRFEHRSVSVFRGFDEFSRINPVVKAPTLVCEDGGVLMDSSLILDYAEALAATQPGSRSLMPAALAERQRSLRLIGLALAACEKSVQIVYEHNLRPAEKVHAPWLNRVQGQLGAALDAIEAELARRPLAASSSTIDQAGVSCAIAWNFVREMQPVLANAAKHPALHAHWQQAEALREFGNAPHGDGLVAGAG
jgi:glutathione S-transferase